MKLYIALAFSAFGCSVPTTREQDAGFDAADAYDAAEVAIPAPEAQEIPDSAEPPHSCPPWCKVGNLPPNRNQ